VTDPVPCEHYRRVIGSSSRGHILVLAVALTVGSIACTAVDVSAESDGRRLHQARWIYDEGGTEREHDQYIDTDLDERCTPTRWSDGATYCAPDAAPAIYTDGHCTAALAAVPEGSAAVFAYRMYKVGSDVLPSKLFRIGAAAAPPAERWELRDDFCYGPYTPDDTASYFELGKAVDLARIRYVTTYDADGYRIESATSDDGLSVPERVFDTNIDVRCDLSTTATGTVTTCKPRSVPPISLYADASCTRLGIAASSRPAVATVHDNVTACDRYFLVGDETSALYSGGAGTCGQVSPPGTYYAITNEFELPPIERRIAGGDGLQSIAVGSLPLEDPLLHDSIRGLDCKGELIDGERYCLPVATSEISHLFSDPYCMTPIELAMVPTGRCAQPGRFARDQSTFYEVLGPYTSPLFAYQQGGGCDYAYYTVTSAFEPHTVGPATPHTSFAHAGPLATP
jgi:hypothetical protein